mmetsp:Transcript_38301/g.81779  ORF Transcript_38301/g.81779 Transcript_38301/m.81779 type:complete len:90 (-) Transcript_38301:63-332(-)
MGSLERGSFGAAAPTYGRHLRSCENEKRLGGGIGNVVDAGLDHREASRFEKGMRDGAVLAQIEIDPIFKTPGYDDITNIQQRSSACTLR